MRMKWLGHWSFWAGLFVGGGIVAAALELPYVNWRPVAAPVDTPQLVVRQDAKGDGRFHSHRSGHRRHRGIDFAAPLDSPVRAIRSGTVVQVGLHRGLGRFVELEHQQQLRSLYAHLNTVCVDVGSRVRQGQRLGTVGKTGNAAHPWITPHLHLEVLKTEQPIDPQLIGLQVVEPPMRFARSDKDLSGGLSGEQRGLIRREVERDEQGQMNAQETTESFNAPDNE